MGEGAIFTGGALILFGLWLGYKIIAGSAPWWVMVYPAVIIGTGIAMIALYKEESKIEGRKDLKKARRL